jgi:hypothetical protein
MLFVIHALNKPGVLHVCFVRYNAHKAFLAVLFHEAGI